MCECGGGRGHTHTLSLSTYISLYISFPPRVHCCPSATRQRTTAALGTLRSELLPESERSSLMNLFRVPLNMLVVVFLLLVGSVSFARLFVVTGVLCCAALAAHEALRRIVARELFAASQQQA